MLRRGHSGHKVARMRQREYTKEDWEKAFKFCFVRNPWDMIVSWFFFYKGSDMYYSRQFADWVRDGLPTHWGTDWCGSMCLNDPFHQEEFFQDDNGEDMVDFVGRFEELQTGIDFVCQQIGFEPKKGLPHNNPTRHAHFSKYYDDTTKKIVADKFKYVIDRFGYECR
jgi:hypothetical protein